ncbi:MAG: hypothetical protein JXO22_04285, partial [Phycisphaerae bacterium]|nr:hypothetical protein [Phycisphaerae bacterium]
YAHYDGARPAGGQDDPTRIRNFLIDAYQSWGTRYALLAGGHPLIPARMFTVAGETMPVDNYYGCADPPACTFDHNANGIYGEPTDGPDGGDVDLLAEVYVGRAPVANVTEVASFVRETLTYDQTQRDYLPIVSMLGEHLGFGGLSEYAKESMEEIRLGSCANGYCTVGFANHAQPDFYDFDLTRNLYDEDGSWAASELISLMNAGTHVFNHLGHANEAYCMKLYTPDLVSLVNTDFFFVYSQGCRAGAFDIAGCFAERITAMEHGAFAVIMNAREGWVRYNSTDGSSQRFNRQFWDAVLAENIIEMGPANQDSKEDNLWDISQDTIRWCYYGLNLFGDPQQALRFIKRCEWLEIDPQNGVVEPGASMPITLYVNTVDDQGQVLAPGTYTADVVVASNDPQTPANTVEMTMTVIPDDMSITPATGFEVSGPQGGSFNPDWIVYTITNTGASSFTFSADWNEEWLIASPSVATVPGGESVSLYVSLTQAADTLLPGTYTDTVTITNTTSGNTRTRPVSLTVGQPHFFTEWFDAHDNDLTNLTLTFVPEDSESFYGICRGEASAFPTDPSGGTALALEDDDYAEVILSNGAEVQLYGTSYTSFFVGSNGYVTFGGGDASYLESPAAHFSLPRIAALFDDLSPQVGGTVSVKQLDDRAAVTFEHVPEFFFPDAVNSFQIEMFFDGRIRLTWLTVAATDGLAGLSAGTGTPTGFVEDDLSAYVPCWTPCDFDHDGDVDQSDFGHFQICLTGSGRPQHEPACLDARLDSDQDVDSQDRAIFLRCMSGPNVPADPQCGE